MKVLIATGLYAPDIGGPATYTRLLEKDLPLHNIDIIVVSFTAVRRYPKIIRHAVFGWQVWRAAKQADIVYALDPVSVGVPALIAARLRHKKFMLRVGGDYAWEQGCVRFGVTQTLDEYIVSQTAQSWPVRLLAAVQSYVATRALVVVAPSVYLKNIVVQWGVAPDQVQVVFSTLVPLISTQDTQQTKSELGLSGPVLVTAGRLVPWKGISALIRVVQQLVQQFPNLTLVVVGDGPQLQELQAQVATSQLETHVRFLGRQDKTQLANIVQAADVFILNTAYEGLSHQLLEVMALGVPIVTTSVGGNPELLTHNVDALLVPFNDEQAFMNACSQLLVDQSLANQLVQAATLRTRAFSREQAISHILAVLETVYETN